MEMTHYQQLGRTSVKDSLRALENDIQHANELAAEIPTPKGSRGIQMRLVYNHLAPFVLFFLGCFDCSLCCFLPRYLNFVHVLIYKVYSDERPTISAYGRKASVKDFYAVILPSLEQLHDSVELEEIQEESSIQRSAGRRRTEADCDGVSTNTDSDRDDECGICLEPRAKVVLPTCCHSMCINCFRDWCDRSESCPFCRGCLRRVMSEDLWILTSKDEVADYKTISSENVQRFYQYIKNLPKDGPDAMFVLYYEYLM